jgi:lipopolysaccharide export system permease protein
MRTELHDRLVAPIYPLAFAVLSFAILGAPRTTRESRGVSLLLAIMLVTGLRMTGFAGIVFGTRTPAAIAIVYVGLAAAFGAGLLLISRGTIVEPPEWAVRGLKALQSRFARPAPQT